MSVINSVRWKCCRSGWGLHTRASCSPFVCSLGLSGARVIYGSQYGSLQHNIFSCTWLARKEVVNHTNRDWWLWLSGVYKCSVVSFSVQGEVGSIGNLLLWYTSQNTFYRKVIKNVVKNEGHYGNFNGKHYFGYCVFIYLYILYLVVLCLCNL